MNPLCPNCNNLLDASTTRRYGEDVDCWWCDECAECWTDEELTEEYEAKEDE